MTDQDKIQAITNKLNSMSTDDLMALYKNHMITMLPSLSSEFLDLMMASLGINNQ